MYRFQKQLTPFCVIKFISYFDLKVFALQFSPMSTSEGKLLSWKAMKGRSNTYCQFPLHLGIMFTLHEFIFSPLSLSKLFGDKTGLSTGKGPCSKHRMHIFVL